MPKAPTWEFHPKAAKAMTDRDKEINGICLRGKAGWGEGGAFITAMSNSFGARWFDEKWNAQFDTDEWANTLKFYKAMMTESGPPGYATNGFNENLSLFQQGKCGMWIDATVAASFVTNPKDSEGCRQGWFCSGTGQWSGQAFELALGLGSGRSGRFAERVAAAKQFIEWATSKAISSWLQPKKAGPTFLRVHGPRSTRTRNTKRCRSPR